MNDGAGGQVQLMRQQQRAVGQTQQPQQPQENVLKEGQIDMDEGEKLNSLFVDCGRRGEGERPILSISRFITNIIVAFQFDC